MTWWRHQMETFYALLAICAGIYRSPVNSLHKVQWHGALMFSLICAWINGGVNTWEAGDLRRHGAHYDTTVMGFRMISVAILNYISMKMLLKSLIPEENFKIMSAFAVSTVSADGLAPSGAGSSVDTVMIRCSFCINCIMPNRSHCVLD